MKNYTREDVIRKVTGNVNKMTEGKRGVQVGLIMALQHTYHHGDWTVFRDIVKQLSDAEENLSSEAQAVTKWAVKFGGLKQDTDKDSETFGQIIGWSGKDHIKENFQTAKATPFWQSQKQEKLLEFDDIQELLGLMSKRQRIKRKAANDENANVTMHDELFDKIMQLVKDEQAAA